MEPRGSSVSSLRMRRRITTSAPEQDHSRSGASIGRAECREKKIGIKPRESFFLSRNPACSGCRNWDDLVSQGGSFGLEVFDLELPMLKLVENRSFVHIFHPVAQHAVDQTSQLCGHGLDGDGSA